jgi:hypothetical protein
MRKGEGNEAENKYVSLKPRTEGPWMVGMTAHEASPSPPAVIYPSIPHWLLSTSR